VGNQKLKRFRWLKRLLRVLIVLALLPLPALWGLNLFDPPRSAFMAARQIEAWRADDTTYRLHHRFVPIERIAPALALAVVAAEDQRFPEHHGFDLESIRAALKTNREGERVRGGSTISQQVVKNLFLWKGQSWLRKGIEAWLTLWLELLVPKQRILELYLNVAEFGDGVYGAQAAAQQFFGRAADRLSPTQAATLAAVLPNPRRYSAARPGPYVQRRARAIEAQMRNLGADYLLALEQDQ
jgi:monofunctional glycosyltransferase